MQADVSSFVSLKFLVFFPPVYRRALRRRESVKYLLQDSVIEYIRENELYGYTSDK